MTDTLRRPAAAQRRSQPPPRSVLSAGLLAALWAVCAGLVAVALPVLLVWAGDARSGAGAGQAMRTAGQVWLAIHGAGLRVPGGEVGLPPLGLTLLPIALLLRAAGHSARESRVGSLRDVAVLTASIAVPYALLAAVVAAASTTAAVRPLAWQALGAGCLVGGLGGFAGVVRQARLGPQLLSRLPARAARLLPAVGAALALLLAAGALLAAGSLLLHLGRAQDLAAATAPGPIGGLGLLLLGLGLVPNAAVWGVSWLAGPGFAVGVGTAVGPFGTVLGPVPSLPLLAALAGPVPTWVGVVALCLPVGAGVLGGLLVVRRLSAPTWRRACREAALVGPAAGAVAALLGWWSGGPVGGARLSELGPSPWQLGLAVAVEVAVGAAAAAVVAVRRGWYAKGG